MLQNNRGRLTLPPALVVKATTDIRASEPSARPRRSKDQRAMKVVDGRVDFSDACLQLARRYKVEISRIGIFRSLACSRKCPVTSSDPRDT